MASFKSHPFFYTSLLLAGALTAGQAWLLFSQRAATRRVSAEIEQKQETLQGFSRSNPFPSRENQAVVEKDRAAVEKTRDEIRQRLHASGAEADKIAATSVPVSSTEEYFNIAGFVELVRDEATKVGVQVAPDNRFGFSAYSTNGPERDLIPLVFHQRQYAEYLLRALIAAKPISLVSLQRELPLTAAQKQQLADAIASGQSAPNFVEGGVGGDYFTMDSRTSARVADFVETMPFRLTFTGYTKSLRDFLNELVTFKVPVVVRSVEVEPISAASEGRRHGAVARVTPRVVAGDSEGAAPAVEAAKALVEQTESRFIVTVEIVSLVDKAAEAAAAESAVPTP